MQRILIASDLENKPGRTMQAVKWMESTGHGLSDEELVIKARALYRLGQDCQAVQVCREDLWGCLEIFEAMEINHPGTVDLCKMREQWRTHQPLDETALTKQIAVTNLPFHPILCEIVHGVLSDRGQQSLLAWKPLLCNQSTDIESLDLVVCQNNKDVSDQLACIWQKARANQDIEVTKLVDSMILGLRDDLILMMYVDRVRERMQDLVYQTRSVIDIMAEPSAFLNGKP